MVKSTDPYESAMSYQFCTNPLDPDSNNKPNDTDPINPGKNDTKNDTIPDGNTNSTTSSSESEGMPQ